jgi:Transglycosylase SLT domain
MMQLRQPLDRRGLWGSRERARFAVKTAMPQARRIVHIVRPSKPIAAPAVPQRRLSAFAWALVATGVAIWAVALSGTTTLFPSSTPVAAAVAPVVSPADEQAAPIAIKQEYVAPVGVRENVWRAIANATEVVGVDATYMTAVAARESSFDPTVRAEGSSAAGLYQFTEDTWLRALKAFGVRHGLDELAQQITIDEYGDLSVRHGARAKLLQLRNDPTLSALMAAELARDNKARLERLLGRDVSPAETYLAHFLGVGQAARIIDAAHSKPHVSGARLLPAAARSNPAVFAPAGHAASAAAIVGKIEAYFSHEVSPSARI